MITLHHLAFSRSLRVLWLLEELGLDYNLISYERTEQFLAPSELAKIHPLGKSPVIVDGDLVLAESATILRYIHDRHGNGKFTPPDGTDVRASHEEWLDYVESSAGLPIMIMVLGQRTGGLNEGLTEFSKRSLAKTLDYIADGIAEGPFIMGEQLTLADMQLSYLLAIAENAGALEAYPAISDYLQRLRQQPGFLRALARGGPMVPAGR